MMCVFVSVCGGRARMHLCVFVCVCAHESEWCVYMFRDVNLPLFGGIPLFFLLSAFLKMIFRFF